MRIGVLVLEAVVALGVGGGAGVGYLLHENRDLHTPAWIRAQERRIEAEERELARQEAERLRLLAEEREKAEAERLALEKARLEEEARLRALAEEEERRKAEAQPKLPAFGILAIRAAAGDLQVDGGPALRAAGRSVELRFEEKPGKITVKSGVYTIVLDPKPGPKSLALAVTVSPMALVWSNDHNNGTSAANLEVDRNPFKLDFRAPAATANLILQYRR